MVHLTLYIGRVQCLLLHPHTWVRLAAGRLFGLLFAAYKPEELASQGQEGAKKRGKKLKKLKQTPEYILQDGIPKASAL